MKKIIYLVILNLVLVSVFANAFQTNSTNYRHYITIVDSGGGNMSSESYKNIVLINSIIGIVNSTNYKTLLGFFHILLLADGQPCTSANQCEGGYCCSSVCSSSSCPVPSVEEAAPGGAAAAAAAGAPIVPKEEKSFEVDKDSISLSLIIKESKTEKITITNTGNVELTFNIRNIGLEGFVSLSENQFKLDADESKRITLTIVGKELGVTIGEIEINADGIKKTIPVVIEVETEKVLFDVKLDILSEYAKILPGGKLKTQITLLNIGPAKKADVIITYLIKNLRGTLTYEESETFAVEGQKSYMKTFDISKSTGPGSYVVIVEVRYANSFAVSSGLFEVIEEKPPFEEIKYNIILLSLVLVFFVAIILYMLIKFLKNKKKR